jgi:hypothetical protein
MSTQGKSETKVARMRFAGGEAFVGESPSGHAIVTSFSHEQVTAPTPMELLLIAIGGCTGAVTWSYITYAVMTSTRKPSRTPSNYPRRSIAASLRCSDRPRLSPCGTRSQTKNSKRRTSCENAPSC